MNTCLSYTSTDLGITEAKGGAVVTSVLLISAAVGGFFAGQVADAIGPRRALVWNTVPFFAGSLMSAIAPDGSTGFWAMLLGAHTLDDRLPCVAVFRAVTVTTRSTRLTNYALPQGASQSGQSGNEKAQCPVVWYDVV